MSHRAVDVFRGAARAADEMVMVVVDAVLVACRGASRLNAPDQTLVGEDTEGVVDGLTGDGADLFAHDLFDLVRRGVGMTRDRPHDGQSLGCHLHPTLAKRLGYIRRLEPGHRLYSGLILD